ncbi:hypothetical protein [Cupriavidus gilardii]
MKLISNILLFIALYIAARILDAMQYHFWGWSVFSFLGFWEHTRR